MLLFCACFFVGLVVCCLSCLFEFVFVDCVVACFFQICDIRQLSFVGVMLTCLLRHSVCFMRVALAHLLDCMCDKVLGVVICCVNVACCCV